MSRSRLELRGGHVIMFQMKVPQVALFRQLAHDVAQGFTFCLCPKSRYPLLARASPLTPHVPEKVKKLSCFSKAVGSCHAGGPFLFFTGAAEGSLGGTKGRRSSSSVSLCHGKGYMSLRVTTLLTRPGRWLIRKIRHVQHNMFHCGVLSWRGIQTKSWT